jgi:hypothetical protein
VNINELTGLIGVVLGVISMIGGFFLWYRGAVVKRYAAERDFNHLRRNQEQMIANLSALLKEDDRRFDTVDDELKEIKVLTLGLTQRFEIILTRLESNSGIYERRPRGEI